MDNFQRLQPEHLSAAVLATLLQLITIPWALAEEPYVPPVTVERMVQRFNVNADGSYRQFSETIIRIDAPQAIDSFGVQRIDYASSRETIDSIEARVIQPDGGTVTVPPESIRTQDEGNSDAKGFSDTKYKVIIFPKVRVGSRLYWKSASTVSSPVFQGQFFNAWTLSPNVSIDYWEINITFPFGKALYIENRGVDGGLEASSTEGDHYRFIYRHPTSVPPEQVAVAEEDYADLLRVSTFPDVLAVGKAYSESAKPKALVTDRIRALALSVTNGLTDDRQKAKALYRWVSKNIRYVGVWLGTGAYVPHSADEVLSNEYGDCKDHVALLQALLHAVGIDSVPVLINSGSSYTLPRVGTFTNHVITYLPSLDLYVDSTAQFAPFGVLPYGDSDKPVILTSLNRLGKTPATHVDTNVTRTKVSMVIHADATIEGTSTATMAGVAEITSRSTRFEAKSDPQDRVVRGLLARFGETGSGSMTYVEPENLDVPYWVEGRFSLDPLANIPGPSAMRVPVGLAPGKFAAMEKAVIEQGQQHPWPCSSTTVSEVYSIQFPSNVAITSMPRDVEYHDSRIKFQSRYRRVGQEVSVERTLIVDRPSNVCSVEDRQHWRDLYRVVQRDLRSQIFYR
jgi:transglutaminase-like putative cysteine protease